MLGQPEQAAAVYAEVIRLDGQSDDAAWARYELAAQGDREGKAELAAAAYEALGLERAHPAVAGVSLLQATRLRAELGEGGAAIADARRLLDTLPHSRHTPQALLLLARQLERMGQTDPARTTFQRIVDELPGTFEARLAARHLGAAPARATSPTRSAVAGPLFLDFLGRIPWMPAMLDPGPAPLLPAPVFTSVAERTAWLGALGDARLARARIHLRLGQLEDAADELVDALAQAPSNPVLLGGMIPLSHAMGRPNRALYYAEKLARGYPSGELAALPRVLQAELYPWPYRKRIEELSGRLGVDPLLAVAVMRQESRFNPAARSLAAARGLMQIVPVTFEGLRRDWAVPSWRSRTCIGPRSAWSWAWSTCASLASASARGPRSFWPPTTPGRRTPSAGWRRRRAATRSISWPPSRSKRRETTCAS